MNLTKLIFLLFPYIIFSQSYNNGEWSNNEHEPQTQQSKKEEKKEEKKEIIRKSVSETKDGKQWFGELILFSDSSNSL